MKKLAKVKRLKKNIEKGIGEGNSKYARKQALARKGIYSPKSPFNRGS
tara:strand:+ start:12478 stop:12621 length:144 start_codon:yes stop_codon:yes gene_type:complete